MGIVVDGNALAREIRDEVTAAFQAEASASGVPPRMAILQLADAAAASQYTRRLQRTFSEAGATVDLHELPTHAGLNEAIALVEALSNDPEIQGIQIQTPLPPQIPLATLLEALDPTKDLDGIHPTNAGRLAQGRPTIVPATPLGGLEILLRNDVPISGARAVVVGRSTPVGRPMALLLLQNDATVTICHTRTTDMGAVVREADIVAVAAGRAGLVKADWIRPGAAVIDFGVNVLDGKTVGDVEPAAQERASLFTPVPGGTGPVTTAMLLRNALTLYRQAIGRDSG
ncbi:MAG: methylenetetrahydrofolate dehydrogenase / methenyltetrahydrofolate cyclohydrolase [Chloroflexota bacterium]|jgi:methylenetetrahydrofolate dehydrogenase (NADP+)/methenyltetrahydrofolate cyclohydrolase|nr:methylenetetrahydrofolate dehydrogenase / methenyltetrahydrofolate cyclohydrolase [Chloroflexota bacterium]